MKTVLNVAHYPVFGGPHNRLMRLAEPLRERGWATLAALPDEPGNATARLRDAGIEVVQLPLGRLRAGGDPRLLLRYTLGYAPDVLRLFRLIRRRRADLILIGGLANAQAALAARLAGVPVVWQIVDSRTPPTAARLMLRLVEGLAGAVMFNGRGIERLHTGGRARRMPAYVYFPPVDTVRFVPSSERRCATRAEFGIPQDAPLVGMVANINRPKGIEFFVRAAARIYRARPDAWFVVIGAFYENHRDYTDFVMAEVRSSGIPLERLIFTDARSDLESIYPALDVKLITSRPRSEGTTTTALEAMACGVPVVASDAGAVREVVEDGVTGLIVPPLNDAALAEATVRLLGDPMLRVSMGAAGRRRAVGRFDVHIAAETHVAAFEAALAHQRHTKNERHPPASSGAGDGGSVELHRRRTLAAFQPLDLRTLLVCPACRTELCWDEVSAACTRCDRTYPIVDGIPILLANPPLAEHDELRHHAMRHKRGQAEYFDRRSADAEEFEISRPYGAAPLYRWLLLEKLRRSVRGIETLLPGAVVADVCGGAGMEAEFLARQGARVVLIDLSLGAARRARERARRTGLAIAPVVADFERLPFRDRGVAVAYVHDGLHHLEDPHRGLHELARVASQAVSVTEPARAALTAAAVRCRLALEREAAGNRVARLSPAEVVEALEHEGLRVLRAERYAMYYRHHPGVIMRVLSVPGLLQCATAGSRLLDAAAGRFGNKLVAIAVRDRQPD